MKRFSLRKGLDVPILGTPRQAIDTGTRVTACAINGEDFVGLKPRIVVAEGDTVGPGSPILYDKDLPEAQVVSPVSGRIKSINRGARRKLISVEIQVQDDAAEPVNFSDIGGDSTRAALVEKLCAAGLWPAFRTRPYSKVPALDAEPIAIYVTAMDTEPLAADPTLAINEEPEAFAKGMAAITLLTEGKTYLCQGDGDPLPGDDLDGVEAVTFSGPHPAGLAGTHMHFLESPTAERFVWTIGYQHVLMIGRLLMTGHYDASCVISLAGPMCKNPRLIRTVSGASMVDLAQDDMPADASVRMISGSVLSGRMGQNADAYLGFYARQVTLIEEDHKQIPLGWIRPMISKYAVQPVLGSAMAKREFPLTSNLNGGRRAMVPLGTFENLMPQDFLPTQLLRALLVMDTDQAQLLGALELDEEDLGLCGFACPAKYEYGLALRDSLTKIEKEG